MKYSTMNIFSKFLHQFILEHFQIHFFHQYHLFIIYNTLDFIIYLINVLIDSFF
jgi:hypothetical protein